MIVPGIESATVADIRVRRALETLHRTLVEMAGELDQARLALQAAQRRIEELERT